MSKDIWYVYPMHHVVSFQLVAKRHIEQLRKKFKVQEIAEKGFTSILPYTNPLVIVHPLLYIAGQDYEHFIYQRSFIDKLIGVEVADSDRVSDLAVNITNIADALIVPSTFSKKAYESSGTKIPIYVVPHGLSQEYYRPPRQLERAELKLLQKIKSQKKYIFLLFFLWHSSHRKGADLVYRVFNNLNKERDNVVLVLKSSSLSIGQGLMFDEHKTILISGWLSDQEVVDLYDLCDIYLLFSRGGGFEINGLEALARGLITLGAEYGAWTDYLPKEFQLPVARWVKVFPDNPYHIGMGAEIDVEKTTDKLIEIIDNIDEWKEKARIYSKYIRENYSWDKVGEKLIKVVENYI